MQFPGKLKALNLSRAMRPGMHADGGGLYLQVTPAGTKSWIYRYWVAARHSDSGEPLRDPATGKAIGKSREMGLGSYTIVSLEAARNRALECRQLRQRGVDPTEAREDAKRRAVLERAKALKFKDAAKAYITAHRIGWKNEKHAAQWTSTLHHYTYPHIGEISVQLIDTTMVMKVLEPVWSTKPETAARLRGRIEAILDWASARGYRGGKSSSVAWTSREIATCTFEGEESQASCRATLRRSSRFS